MLLSHDCGWVVIDGVCVCVRCCIAAAGLTQMLDYYAGNSYDEGDGRMGGSNGSSRGARSGEMQVSG